MTASSRSSAFYQQFLQKVEEANPEAHVAGYVEDRWIKKKDPVTGKRERTARYGKGKRYKVAGILGVRDRSFDTREDAKAWLRRAATDEERGEFVDPRDGSITLADYIAMHWAPGTGACPRRKATASGERGFTSFPT